VKRWHAVGILLSSVVLLGVRTLDIYWDEFGRTDADHFWAAGLAARHGTLRYIHDVGRINDPATWTESRFFRLDPEAFRALVRPPGYLVLYDYPPVFAVFCVPFSYVSQETFAAIWYLLSVVLYLLSIWRVVQNERLKFVLSALALHFPPFLRHLEFGSTVIIVVGLALCAGSFGIALSGWLKLYPWVITFVERKRRHAIITWIVLLGVAGLVASQFSVRHFYALLEGLQQHQRAGGHAGIGTWIRVGLAALALLWAIRRRWPPAVLLAIAQALSPVWWPAYWCAMVPAAGLLIEAGTQRLKAREGGCLSLFRCACK